MIFLADVSEPVARDRAAAGREWMASRLFGRDETIRSSGSSSGGASGCPQGKCPETDADRETKAHCPSPIASNQAPERQEREGCAYRDVPPSEQLCAAILLHRKLASTSIISDRFPPV